MSFKIGRRGSIGENYCGNKPDFLIAELEPFTVSRHHCSIKKTKNGAMIKDLGSKTGFMIMNERFGGRRGQKDRVEVGPGEHILILGPRGGHARFKLTIT
ncbi:MAG: FHA domain-containing protein [Verrucomicrobiota bacterium]